MPAMLESTTTAAAGLVLAGGIGTRFRSRTPKVVHPLLGRPMVAWPVTALAEAGVDRTVVVAAPHTREAIAASVPDAEVTVQHDALGTGDAAAVGVEALGEHEGAVTILSGDVPGLRPKTLVRLLDEYQAQGGGMVLLTANLEDPTGYGRVVRSGADGDVTGIVEHRDADPETRQIQEINAGVYVAEKALLDELLPRLSTDNEQNELYLVEAVSLAREAGAPVSTIVVEDPDEIRGINDRAQLAEAACLLRDRIVRHWQLAGVTFDDPRSAWVTPDVELATDVRIGPHVELSGATRVATGARIDQGCVVRGSEIGSESRLLPYVVMEDARLEGRCQAGPFTHLRPGTRLGEGARAGNFVEMKKATLGPGSKANHLSYLGDTTVGSGVNIGAGTITCNYDGVEKHPTTIEDGAFIGSDTQLVAPVRIGRDAIVGAGTTVTRDVADEALAISRTPQKEIPGYARRRQRKRTSDDGQESA